MQQHVIKLNIIKLNKLIHKVKTKYEKKINNDPDFRTKFSKVCNLLGIDPVVVKK